MLRDAYRIAQNAWFAEGAKDWTEIRLQALASMLHLTVLVMSVFALLHHVPRLRLALAGKHLPRGL